MSPITISEDRFVRDYSLELRNGSAAVFVGAGLSMPAGFVSWKGLLNIVFNDLNLNPEIEHDLVTIAQYYCNQIGGNKIRLTQRIIDAFKHQAQPTRNHAILASLPISIYWTTNYDKLIETALTDAKKIPDVKFTPDHLETTLSGRNVTVYKMHGDVDHASIAVIVKDDYEKYPYKMSTFLAALRGDLIERTFLFLGFSFTDPNIDYILGRIRGSREENTGRVHYCILKAVGRESGDTDSTLQYKQLKQSYFIKDLLRYNILCVLVDEYTDITRILDRVSLRFKMNSVFISGAGHEYGQFGVDEARVFLHQLSSSISSAGNRVISGFGLGVGDAVINGVLESLENRGKSISEDVLVLRPFPQSATGALSLSDLWTRYRIEIAAVAGIAVFVFGNKLDGDNTVHSSGMEEEFALCHNVGAKLIAIGATGYIASVFHNRIVSNWDEYFPNTTPAFRELYETLGDHNKQLNEHVQTVVKLISILQEN